jgi:transglutaminase-like putative cysteine protease
MIRAEPRPFDLVPSTGWRRIADALERADAPLDVVEFRHPSPLVPALPQAHSLIRPLLGVDRPTLALLRDLMGLIAAEFVFDPTATSVATPLAEVFATRRGVCQDFAHVAIACLRAAGLAARYHSGYIETLPPPGQPRLVGTDASHAWVGCWCPSLGWIEADPTNALLPAPHMTIAWGRDFADVPPIKGVILGGGHQRLTVSVDVQRVHDDRREEP